MRIYIENYRNISANPSNIFAFPRTAMGIRCANDFSDVIRTSFKMKSDKQKITTHVLVGQIEEAEEGNVDR